MLKKPLASVLFLGMLVPLAVAAQGQVASFDGGIGVHPASNIATANVVRGVNPAGQLWVIERLRADINRDGRIKADGRGLVLAGGNNIGRATGQRVFATLICEPVANTFITHNSNPTGVPLEPNGDFRIDDALMPAPFECNNPVLLIRNAAGQNWFAAGILKQ
jgi:hypothetical protein